FSVTARGKAGGEPLRVALDPRLSLDVRLQGLEGVDEAFLQAEPVWQGWEVKGGVPSRVEATGKRGEGAGAEAVVRLAGLRPGSWVVRAWAPGHDVAAPATVSLPEGARDAVPTALVPSAGVVVGRVLSAEDGRPMGGVEVEVSQY